MQQVSAIATKSINPLNLPRLLLANPCQLPMDTTRSEMLELLICSHCLNVEILKQVEGV